MDILDKLEQADSDAGTEYREVYAECTKIKNDKSGFYSLEDKAEAGIMIEAARSRWYATQLDLRVAKASQLPKPVSPEVHIQLRKVCH